jgi:type II secretion system protein L
MSASRLWLRIAADGGLAWLARDGQGRVFAGPAAVAAGETPQWPEVDEVVVVWAEAGLVMRRVDLPAGARGKWRQGLPYLAEEWVAADVAELHVVAPLELIGAQCWVAVVERRTIDGLLTRLRGLGLEPDHLLPEPALLGPGRAADVLIDGDRVSFASPAGLAGCCETELLEFLAGAAPASLRRVAVGTGGDGVEGTDSALRWISLQPLRGDEVDLMQGPYARPQRSRAGAGWWRIAAGLLAAAVLLQVALVAFDVHRLGAREAVLLGELESRFREVFGPEARMVDPAVQLRNEWQRLSAGGGGRVEVLALLKRVAPLLASDSRLVLRGFIYTDGALELTVSAPDAARFEGLREQILLDPAIAVEVGSTQIEGDRFTGRLRLARRSG